MKPQQNELDTVEIGYDLKPIDEETMLQEKLQHWINHGSELKIQLEEAKEKVKFYEKAIKAYNKAFKK